MPLGRFVRLIIILHEVVLCSVHALPLEGDSVVSPKWYKPDFITLQFAGNIGFISGGAGYSCLKDRYQVSLLYGYVPESVADATIHLITLKNSFTFFTYSYTSFNIMPYAGLTGTFETGNNSFLVLPSRFRTGYYRTNAFHATFYLGAKSKLPWKGGHQPSAFEVFIEAGSADVFLFYKIREREVLLREVVNLAMGFTFFLDQESKAVRR